jgi:hypothetical protein
MFDYDFNTAVALLKIENAQLTDIGNYVAFATNEVGKDSTNCKVFVNETPNIDETPIVNPDAFKFLEHAPHKARPDDEDRLFPPKVIIPLADATFAEGQTVILACKIDGLPKPKLTWYKDSKLLPASNRFTHNYDLNTAVVSLKMENAQVHDIGNYRVIASNDAGTDQTECSVFVAEIPNIDQRPMVNPDAFRFLEQIPLSRKKPEKADQLSPPKVIVPLSNVKLEEGKPFVLACKIIGSPKPNVIFTSQMDKRNIPQFSDLLFKITWFKDSQVLPAANR